jgi:hypothetical protein
VITVFQDNVTELPQQELQQEVASLLEQAGLKTHDMIEPKRRTNV